MRHLRTLEASIIAAVVIVGMVLTGVTICRAADTKSQDDLDGRIARLIQQLGDSQYTVRERAQKELMTLGAAAFDALSEAEDSDDVEIASQAKYLVRSIRVDWTKDTDPAQVRNILRGYEFDNETARLAKIKQLANLSADQGLEWLCRVARFEQSPLLSKQAALAIILQEPQPDTAWPDRAETITKGMDRSTRPAAKWLKTYVRSHEDPNGALAVWNELVDAERQTLEQHPRETSPDVIVELLRRQVEQLDRLNRPHDATEIMHEMVRLDRGDRQSLTDLVSWLMKRQAWSLIDDVYTRFASRFDTDAMLLYALAEARAAEGNQQAAGEAADKALKLGGDKPDVHLDMAVALRDRGLLDGSDREYRQVIKLAPTASEIGIRARLKFSDSLHDRELDEEAADTLKRALDEVEKSPNLARLIQQGRLTLDAWRAQMNFFYACHAAKQGDRAGQTKYLEAAVKQDPSNADVLIALYRLPNQDSERHKQTLELIRQCADEFRKEIEESPDDATRYNQLAWLVGNTEGDIDEAIRMSHKSIELERVSGYLDTLAHCYYAKRDFENAVKYQSEAIKLDPYSYQIARQLKVFREALARQKRATK